MNNQAKKTLSEVEKGNFKLVNEILNNSKTKLDSSTVVNIVIACCKIVTKKESFTIDEEELYILLTTCTEQIKQVDENVAKSYLQSVYFILQYYFQKDNFIRVLQMENIIMPQFMTTFKTDKVLSVYKAIWIFYHNTISKLSTLEQHNETDLIYFQLCTLSLKLQAILCPTKLLLANKACTYSKSTRCYKSDVTLQYNYYLQLLKLMEESVDLTKDDGLADISNAVLSILDVVIKNFFKKDEFNKVNNFIEDAIKLLGKYCTTQKYASLLKILESVVHSIVKLTDFEETLMTLKTNFSTCLKTLKLYNTTYGWTTEFKIICDILYSILLNLSKHYEVISSDIWNLHMVEKTQTNLYQLLGYLGYLVASSSTKCQFCSCKVTMNVYLATCFTIPIGNLFKTSISNQTEVSNHRSAQTLHFLKQSCIFIETLKKQECTSWKHLWNNLGITIYNIGAKLYSLKHQETYKYFILLIKYIITFEGTAISKIFINDLLSITLHCLSELFLEFYEFRKALMFSAVHIWMRPDTSLKQWIRIKFQGKEISETDFVFQQLTTISVLEQNEQAIKEFYPEFDISTNLPMKIKLLLGELKQYKMSWPSKKPMLSAFRKLYENADLLITVTAMIHIWGNNLSISETEFYDITIELTTQLELQLKCKEMKNERDKNIEMSLCLAYLYTMQYYFQTTQLRKQISEDMNKTVKPLLPLQDLSNNQNDICDVVPTYINLTLDEHLKTIKLLSEALNLFDESIAKCTSSNLINKLKEDDTFNFISKIAQEFKLHCNLLLSVKAWLICLKVSKLLENDLFLLETISSLLQISNMNSKLISELLLEGESLVDKLSTINSTEVLKVISKFYISKSSMLLLHQKIHIGFENYQKALEYFNKIPEGTNDELLQAQLELLYVRYLYLPCELQIRDHDVHTLSTFSRVFKRITNYMKDEGYASSIGLLTLFEINEVVAHTYRWLCLPREVRCYCRDIIIIAQQLVIPLRTATILTYLSQADLQSFRLDDCQVKLNGLSNILCLLNKKTTVPVKINSDNNIKLLDDISELTENFSEILLDCVVNINEISNLSGSPLFVKPFKLPPFINHKVNCDCFYCMNFDYKNLVLSYINLEAELNISRNNINEADMLFKEAFQLYKHMIYRNNIFKKNGAKLLSYEILPDLNDIIWERYCSLLLDYGKHLLRINKMNKSKIIHQELLNIVTKNKYLNMYLFNEVHMQYATLIISDYQKIKNASQEYSQVHVPEIKIDNSNQLLKTPENNKSTVTFTNHFSPDLSSPPKRQIRKIKCNFSEKKLKINQKLQINVSPTNDINDRDHQNTLKTLQTPYKSSISTHPTRTNLAISNPTNACASSSNNRESSVVIAASPDAYTPNALKVPTALHTRTEKLTKKLAKSLKKDLLSNCEDENNKEKTEFKGSVRKNLIKDLNSVTSCKNILINRRTNQNTKNKDKPENNCGTTLTSKALNKQ